MTEYTEPSEGVGDESEPFSESEEDLGTIRADLGFDAVVVSTDWTAETILGQIRRGNIELDPEFQRRDAWNRSKKSRLIESFIVGLPVPQIVLAERKGRRGGFIVLDGKQRLLTLQQFAGSESSFRLTGLDVRPDLNRLTYEKLPEADRLALDTQTIRTVVVRHWQSDEFLYVVFLRLNTASVPLSPQELRQALHPGPFVRFVNSFTAEHEEFHWLFRRSTPDFRMRDVELLVRYFAFVRFLPLYIGNLKPLLDTACLELNASWETEEAEIVKDAEACRDTIDAVFEIFKDDAFRRWSGDRYERPFNRAIFDVMTYYGREDSVRNQMRQNASQIREKLKEVCLIPEFTEAITTTTKSREAIFRRLSTWGAALEDVIQTPVNLPRINSDGRIVYT